MNFYYDCKNISLKILDISNINIIFTWVLNMIIIYTHQRSKYSKVPINWSLELLQGRVCNLDQSSNNVSNIKFNKYQKI